MNDFSAIGQSSLVVPATRRRVGFTAWIVLGLLLGIAAGIFLGEYAERLKFIGDVYIGLMQMTVLPYIVCSLIANVGRLQVRDARVLASAGLIAFVALWAIASLVVLVISQGFPEQQSGAFFSTSLVQSSEPVDFLALFIPSNPFHALASNAVPAVVVFCLLLGIALVGIENKASLLEPIGLAAKALHRANGMVVKLTPVGVFGIAAAAAGTMTLQEFGRLQGYYLGFGICTLLLTFWILPMVVSSTTPFTYRQVLGVSRDALLTAFVTGSVFPVIPLLIDGVEELFQERFEQHPVHAQFPEFILPLAYPFPDSGNVIDLIFIPFAAWFLGSAFDLGDELYMLGTSFFLLFGKVYLTVPFLLTSLHIPHDMFQLFLAAGVIAARVGDLVSTMHFLVFTTLTTAFMTGLFRIRWRRLVWTAAGTAGLALVAVLGMRLVLQSLANDHYGKESVVAQMQSLVTDVDATVLAEPAPNPEPLLQGETRLDRIKRRGILRVGYHPDRLPFSYTNGAGELVGFDVDMMHQLARDLGVALEFVPYRFSRLTQQLQADHFDIVISGLTDTLDRSVVMLMSDSYLTVNMGLVVPDHLREAFANETAVQRLGPVRVGATKGSYFARRAKDHFPNFEIVELESPRSFFEDPTLRVDALVTNLEGGSAWTLIYPGYAAVNPLQRPDSAPLAFGIVGHDPALGQMLRTWITLQKMDGTIQELFEHWIMGKTPEWKRPRWSVIRDVLHWVH